MIQGFGNKGVGLKNLKLKGQSQLLKIKGEQYFVTHTSNFWKSVAAVWSSFVNWKYTIKNMQLGTYYTLSTKLGSVHQINSMYLGIKY